MNTHYYAADELEVLMSDPEVMAMAEELYLIFGGIILGALAVGLILGLLVLIASWKIFKKAGTGGWKALIPVYNSYTFYKISWKPKFFWISLLLTVFSVVLEEIAAMESIVVNAPYFGLALAFVAIGASIAALVIDIKMIVKLAKAFRKGGGFAVGLIFLPFIFYPILGFGKAKYRRRKRKQKQPALPAGEVSAE